MNKMILMNSGEGKRMTRDELQELIGDLGGIAIAKDVEEDSDMNILAVVLIAYVKRPTEEEEINKIYTLRSVLMNQGTNICLMHFNAILPMGEYGTIANKLVK